MLAEISVAPDRAVAFAVNPAVVIGNAGMIDVRSIHVRRQLLAVAVQMMHRATLEIVLAARIGTASRRRAQIAGGHDFIDFAFHYGFLC